MALLLALMVVVSCGNPIGKTKGGRQQRQPGDGPQVEQPDNGSNKGSDSTGSGSDEGLDDPGASTDGTDDDVVVRGGGTTGAGDSGSSNESSYNGESVKALLAMMPDTHPRLMMSDERLNEVGRLRKSDRTLNKLIRDAINKANKYLKAQPIQYQTSGPAMLRMAHEALKRTYALGFAWRATKDQKYADKLEQNLLNLCSFKDWAPDHFLATAEMAHAVGIGYDWGFSGLSASSKDKIRAGLLRNALNPGLSDMNSSPPVDWVKTEYNWNFVCNGGLVIGALAIAEDEPAIAERIIEFARDNLVKTFETYSPDGAWPEGAGYWSYATHYAVYTLAAMQTALGVEFGLSQIEGLADTGMFAVAMTSQTGKLAAFADVEGGATRKGIPVLFWLAEHYNTPELATEELEYLKNGPGSIQHLLWYPNPEVVAGDRPRPPLDAYFDGKVELLFMRGGYEKDDMFVPFKAGFNKVHHGHLDLGNFEMEALGVRWARDLGSDNYSLPGYWESRPGGRRWSYYRIGSFSHNVLTFGGEQQDVGATSEFTRKKLGFKDPCGVIDIVGAFPKYVSAQKRGVKMVHGRRTALVQDEYTLTKATDVTWGISTDATIVLNGDKATLRQNGKEMIVEILEPAGATFYKEAAVNQSGAKSNKGVSRLLMKVSQGVGQQRIAVQFKPVWPDTGTEDTVRVRPLKDW